MISSLLVRKVIMMDYVNGYFEFMKKATTPVQSVDTVKNILKENGFKALSLKEEWNLSPGEKCYVSPFPTMVVAFTLGSKTFISKGFRIIGAHTDNPGFKIKPSPEVVHEGMMTLNVERYGGPIFSSWFDRPLSLAGRIAVRSDDILKPKIIHVDFARPVLTIPSLAIHMNRNVNEGEAIKVQKELQPLLTNLLDGEVKKDYFLHMIAEEAGVNPEEILDMDMNIYCYEEGTVLGAKGEYMSCPRIDDLSMVYAATQAIIDADHIDGINLAAFMDNEEIGSMTKQGADSVLLSTIVEKIRISLKRTPDQFMRQFRDSFIISADGAHALHPNYGEKSDITNKPVMNKGVTIKISGSKFYSSEVESIGALQQLCDKAGISYQKFVNHSDQKGGASLGPIMNKYLPIHAVDLGVPMLSMHSTREIMGKQDFLDSIELFKTFYQL